MDLDILELTTDFVDYLMPELTPYEASLYLFLARNSIMRNGDPSLRIGKRTIALGFGAGSRGKTTNYGHITEVVGKLEAKGCIRAGDTSREGTLYTVVLPREVPVVAAKLAAIPQPGEDDGDYYTDPSRRLEVFERDAWVCQYCGESVTADNATLDHFVPQCEGGTHAKSNLRTACLVCNGVKSGKSYDEAAPAILRSIRERRQRSQ